MIFAAPILLQQSLFYSILLQGSGATMESPIAQLDRPLDEWSFSVMKSPVSPVQPGAVDAREKNGYPGWLFKVFVGDEISYPVMWGFS